jgi:pimeloyl-ACP methyl ester carboxylesterase
MRRDGILALAGIILVVAGAAGMSLSAPRTFEIQMDACHTPATVMEPYHEPPIGDAIVLHGMGGNRQIMAWTAQWLAAQNFRVYIFDLAGHGDSTEHFTYANAESCAGDAIAALADRGDIHLDRTVLVGHSMGGEIAIRLADRFPTAATITLSPAPMVAPQRMPSNLLVISAQFDLPWLKSEARHLARDAGGARAAPEDFVQRRAFALVHMRFADHASPLFDARAGKLVAAWARQALGVGPTLERMPGAPRLGFVLGIVGLILLFPLAATLIAGRARARLQSQPYADVDPEAKSAEYEARSEGPPAIAAKAALANWGVAALFAVALLAAVPHYGWLGLQSGSYLTTIFLIAGIALFFLVRRRGVAIEFNWSVRGVLAAIALGLIFAIAFREWCTAVYAPSWIFRHSWIATFKQTVLPTAPRLLRFGAAALAIFPYLLAEQIALGPRLPGANWRRFGMFVALRLELWIAMVAAVLITMNGQILIGLLLPGLMGISAAQHWGSEAIRRRTGSLAAAAIFGAIIGGWFIATIFPLT